MFVVLQRQANIAIMIPARPAEVRMPLDEPRCSAEPVKGVIDGTGGLVTVPFEVALTPTEAHREIFATTLLPLLTLAHRSIA